MAARTSNQVQSHTYAILAITDTLNKLSLAFPLPVSLDTEVVVDEEDDLLLVDLAVDRCLDALREVGVERHVVIPDL